MRFENVSSDVAMNGDRRSPFANKSAHLMSKKRKVHFLHARFNNAGRSAREFRNNVARSHARHVHFAIILHALHSVCSKRIPALKLI